MVPTLLNRRQASRGPALALIGLGRAAPRLLSSLVLGVITFWDSESGDSFLQGSPDLDPCDLRSWLERGAAAIQ
jgi:hypothetical protein